jgi:hypothetical protein
MFFIVSSLSKVRKPSLAFFITSENVLESTDTSIVTTARLAVNQNPDYPGSGPCPQITPTNIGPLDCMLGCQQALQA